MRVLKNIVIALLIGILLAGIFSQFTTSNYPPCDLVVKGIGVSTYGCSNSTTDNYPCKNIAPDTSQMTSCIQKNYYRSKTLPFGFKQSFGPQSNLIDQKPINDNRLATFTSGFIASLVILFVVQARKKPQQKTEK